MADTICGTPEYIAPEVILGKRYDHTIDFYCLGLLIFEMISGYNPYKVNFMNQSQMFDAIIDEESSIKFPRNFTKS